MQDGIIEEYKKAEPQGCGEWSFCRSIKKPSTSKMGGLNTCFFQSGASC